MGVKNGSRSQIWRLSNNPGERGWGLARASSRDVRMRLDSGGILEAELARLADGGI